MKDILSPRPLRKRWKAHPKNVLAACLRYFYSIFSNVFNYLHPKTTTKIYTNHLLYTKGLKEIKKNNINTPIKPNKSISSTKETVNPFKTAGIYKLKYHNSNRKDGNYIEVTIREIKKLT